jgi:hypothetical protein
MLMVPHNPPEYAGFVEAAGYRKVKEKLAARVRDKVGAELRQIVAPRSGLIRLRRRTSIIAQAPLLLLGVLPEYRAVGLFPLLIGELRRHIPSIPRYRRVGNRIYQKALVWACR